MNCYFESKPTVKVDLDLNTCWEDLLAYYKSTKADCSTRIRIALNGNLTIDTGGIRRQIYTQVFAEFAQNKHIYTYLTGLQFLIRRSLNCHTLLIFYYQVRSLRYACALITMYGK